MQSASQVHKHVTHEKKPVEQNKSYWKLYKHFVAGTEFEAT